MIFALLGSFVETAHTALAVVAFVLAVVLLFLGPLVDAALFTGEDEA